MTVAVVDYGVGNLRSVAKTLEAVGATVCVSGKPDDLRRAERIVLPGQAGFRDGMANLKASGLIAVLDEEVRKRGKPYLGICLGLQLLAEVSYENGEYAGLGWLPGEVRPLPARDSRLKLPHIGWNDVAFHGETPLAEGIKRSPIFYFDHSYHFHCADRALTIATCDYGGPFTAAVLKDNLFAVQFHPEKSQEVGLKLLRNFLAWKPLVQC